MIKNDKIGIGIVASERNNFSWLFIQSLLKLQARMPGIEIIHAHCGNIADGRNYILNFCRQKNLDCVCMIDSDMTFPADGIEKLLKIESSIVAGLYFLGEPTYQACAYKDGIPVADFKFRQDIDSCGMGFTLIRRECFDISFALGNGIGEDFTFCKSAIERGYRIELEPSVRAGHIRTITVDEPYLKLINRLS